jgi:hypothetical protein
MNGMYTKICMRLDGWVLSYGRTPRSLRTCVARRRGLCCGFESEKLSSARDRERLRDLRLEDGVGESTADLRAREWVCTLVAERIIAVVVMASLHNGIIIVAHALE